MSAQALTTSKFAHTWQRRGHDVPANSDSEVVRGSKAANKAMTSHPNRGRCAESQRREIAGAYPPSPEYGRDTAYVCDSCRAVIWDPVLREPQASWKFCPCCGSELMVPGAQASYSVAAQQTDTELEEMMDVLGRAREVHAQRGAMARVQRERSNRACGTHLVNNWIHGMGRLPIQSGAMQSTTAILASKLLRTKPTIKRRTHKVRHKKARALDLLLKKIKNGRLQGQSRHCDVCGHRDPEVKCLTCPSSFHKVCLGLGDTDVVEDQWSCHTCKHSEIQESFRFAPEIMPIAETARTHWKPCNTPMQCSSCGYHETEAMKCDSCARWFCFACMCLSAATLPLNTWRCADCVGQDRYDEERRKLIEISCRRIKEDKVTAKEQDGFAQLVFDLSCTCNWEEWERNIDALIEHARKQLGKGEIPVVMPFHSLHYARKDNGKGKNGMDKMMIRRISEAYAKHAKEEAYRIARVKMRDDQDCTFKVWKSDRLKFDDRLRIGYLSSDFVDHPTADLIQSALLKHNRDRFEIFLYSISREDESNYRQTLSGQMEHFRHFNQTFSDKKCAEIIADDGIHILINLNGHTAGDRNGISALRPAPLQLVYLAYPGTMGADYIDYNVTDKVVCPAEHRKYYTEKLLYMPHCYQTNSFRELYSDVHDPLKLPSRADHQLPEEPTFVFCNFCRLGRITPDLFAVWMRILERVPDSVIWLYKHPKAAVARLQSQAVKAGVASERLIFGSPCSPKLEHLKRVTLANLALDTLVYNGHTTASDMLWAGVPYITLRGDNWPSLVASCIAEACEMHEMVVSNLQEYEDKAVELATKPNLLRKLKNKLESKRKTAPLFDNRRWIGDFERGLDEVWRRFAENDQNCGHLVVKDLKSTSSPRLHLVENENAVGSPLKVMGNGANGNSTNHVTVLAGSRLAGDLRTAGRPTKTHDAEGIALLPLRDEVHNDLVSKDVRFVESSPKRKQSLKNAGSSKKRRHSGFDALAIANAKGDPFKDYASLRTRKTAEKSKEGERVVADVFSKAGVKKKRAKSAVSISCKKQQERRIQGCKKQDNPEILESVELQAGPEVGEQDDRESQSANDHNKRVNANDGQAEILIVEPLPSAVASAPSKSEGLKLALKDLPTTDTAKRNEIGRVPKPAATVKINSEVNFSLREAGSARPPANSMTPPFSLSEGCLFALKNSPANDKMKCNELGYVRTPDLVPRYHNNGGHLHVPSHSRLQLSSASNVQQPHCSPIVPERTAAHGAGVASSTEESQVVYMKPRVPVMAKRSRIEGGCEQSCEDRVAGCHPYEDLFVTINTNLRPNNLASTGQIGASLTRTNHEACYQGASEMSVRGLAPHQDVTRKNEHLSAAPLLGGLAPLHPAAHPPKDDGLGMLAQVALAASQAACPGALLLQPQLAGDSGEQRCGSDSLNLGHKCDFGTELNQVRVKHISLPIGLPAEPFYDLSYEHQPQLREGHCQQQLRIRDGRCQEQHVQNPPLPQHQAHHQHHQTHSHFENQEEAVEPTQVLHAQSRMVSQGHLQADWMGIGRIVDVFALHSGANPNHRLMTGQQVLNCSRDKLQNTTAPVQALACSQKVASTGGRDTARQQCGGGRPQQRGGESLGTNFNVATSAKSADLMQTLKRKLIEDMKDSVKARVRHLCNVEYRMHIRCQSATEAVKNHLKQVATHAQNRLIKHLAKLGPGQEINDARFDHIEAGLQISNGDRADHLAYMCVLDASKRLVPAFHWLSESPPGSKSRCPGRI